MRGRNRREAFPQIKKAILPIATPGATLWDASGAGPGARWPLRVPFPVTKRVAPMPYWIQERLEESAPWP